MGAYEAGAPASVEAPLKYHPETLLYLTYSRYPGDGPGMVGSLTGAVASQRVTEARDGRLRLVGNQLTSAMAKACLTARPTSRAETKVGHSDPVVFLVEGPSLNE